MAIDNYTLLIASGAVYGVLGILFLYMWRQDRRASWFAWFALTYLFAAGAIGFFSLRGQVSLFGSMGVGTALLLMCFGSMWMGCRVFEGRKVMWLPLLVAPSLWLLSFTIPEISGRLGLRVIIASVPAAAFFMMGAVELWRGRGEILPSRKAMTGFMFSSSLFFSFRIAAVGLLPFPVGGLAIHPVAMAVFNFFIVLHALFLTVLIINMTKERHEAEQRALAESDALTGLPNRRAFASEAERLLRKQKNNHAPLAMLILDLDHFKSINDRFGHDAGDRVLVEFGEVLMDCLRVDDFRYRMGGEEFCCLLPGLTLREAQETAERICETFQALTVEVLGGAVRCTVSIGISSTDICGYVMEDLLNEADAATYEAKASGRNRAVLAIAKPKLPTLALVDPVTDIRTKWSA